MAHNGYVAHDDPEPYPRVWTQRLRDCGYSSGVGENIAFGPSTADEVFQSWLNSDVHRRNIEDPKYSDIGVGAVTAASGRTYWTQDFGAQVEQPPAPTLTPTESPTPTSSPTTTPTATSSPTSSSPPTPSSPTPTATPTSTTSPTPASAKPNEVEAVLVLRRHLVARGRLFSSLASCVKDATVEIQRRRSGTWSVVETKITAEDGTFRVRIPDKWGTYRAFVDARDLSSTATPRASTISGECLSGASSRARHRH